MIVLGGRNELEGALVRALSRHIGYTAGAYDLERIFSILDLFEDRPSAVKEEIIDFLEKRDDRGGKGSDKEKSTDYISEVITIARALGIIQQTSTAESRLQKFSPTELGRSIFSARKIHNSDFYRFFSARVAFLADADSLVAMLAFYGQGLPNSALFDFYANYFESLRERRKSWLSAAFSERTLFDRIASRLGWMTATKNPLEPWKIDLFTRNTARHHSTPRKGWLRSFGMLDEGGFLTRFGRAALESLHGESEYFWLGPPRGVQEALRIPHPEIMDGPFEDEFNFMPRAPVADDIETGRIVDDVAEVMSAAFPFARLVHASQASLELPVEYVRYRSYQDEVVYDPLQVLDAVFRSHKEQFDRLSAHKGKIGFYRVK